MTVLGWARFVAVELVLVLASVFCAASALVGIVVLLPAAAVGAMAGRLAKWRDGQ